MDYFANEVAKGNRAAAKHAASIAAYYATPEGLARMAEDLAEEAEAIAVKEARLKVKLAAMRAERRAEEAACFNVVRTPYTGRVVARYRVR